jgi:O-antigen/teichoic acid export membrane protein
MVFSVAVAKILGVLYIIPLTHLISNVGLGIYQNGYTLYMILLTLATSGFPTAMGKLIAERLAKQTYDEAEQIFAVTMRTVGLLAVVSALVTWFGAPLFSRLVALRAPGQAVAALVPSIRALAPAVLVVPFVSALRGYMQGFQRMDVSGYSQAIEQIFRVLTMILGAELVMHWHPHDYISGAAAATFGACLGAVAALLLLLFATAKLRRKLPQSRTLNRTMTNKEVRRLLWMVALPVSAGAMVVPISTLADSFTVQNLLMWTGKFTFQQATAEYGILSRQAVTLIQLPLTFALAIGASILPAIASAITLKNYQRVQQTVKTTFRSMFFITLPMVACFLVLAGPLDWFLFSTNQGEVIITSVSFMGIFSSLELTSTFILQGYGEMYKPVRNMLLGVLVKVILNFLLIWHFYILGAAIATTIGYLFSSALNVLAVKKYGRIDFSVLKLATPSVIASFVMVIVLLVMKWGIAHFLPISPSHYLIPALVQILGSVAIGGVVYIAVSIRIRAVSADELHRLPAVGRYLEKMARRLQPSHLRYND